MPRTPLHSLLCAVLTAAFAFPSVIAAEEEPVDFNDQIRPLLSDRCFTCHGFDANAREADLRLDTPEGALEKREDANPAIVPGNLKTSLVWQRIIATDPDDVMPPADSIRQLSKEDKALIRRWIEEGANYEPHWTFVPVEKPEVEQDAGHPVDQLVSRRLKKEDLTLSPEADKHTLARRLSFDLRGLPPTPEEVEQFLNNKSPDAWSQLVDLYLADPAFGERMAWPWLEAARYADTNGFQGDNERTMWPWRDWVIEAFNKNLPYDDFTVWQIAGDLLPDPTFEQQLATGFLRNHAINGEGGSIPEENRVNYVMDMAETVGTIWMALTYHCCRCHDHKYDPLTQKEYYGLTDFFNHTPVTGGGGDPQTAPILAAPTDRQKSTEQTLVKEQQDLRKQLPTSEEQLKWEQTQASSLTGSTWTPLPISSAKAEALTLTVQKNGAILASDKNPEKDTYTIEIRGTGTTLTGLLLEALRHPSMTKGGLSRSSSGNFVLTGFEVAIRKADGTTSPVVIKSAEATYEQGPYKVQGALDKNSATGWAVYEGKPVDRDHAAVFRFANKIELTEKQTLLITLHHQSPHAQHNLGHFRINGTTAASPQLPGNSKLVTALKVLPAKRSKEQQQVVRDAFLASDPKFRALQSRDKTIDKELADLRKGISKVMIMADRKEKRKTHILAIGSYEAPGEEVIATTPSFLPPLGAEGHANRLDLARWLVSREHPLTSRVTVNRLWQEFFGIGLVKSTEDFGVQSEIPVHPELLDWLAADFMDHGWDYKRLVRNIVTSKTYRQSSAVTSTVLERDPANRLLARGPRFRLPSWMIRDQALAVSGRLIAQQGGEPVKPWQPEGLWAEVTFGGGKKRYVPDTGEKLRRRSLYTFWRRISAPPMFFDSAKREVCEVGVARTNSPLHALSTLNDPLYVETSRALAARAVRESSADPAAALARAFTIVQAHPPSADELAILVSNYETAKAIFAQAPKDAEAFLSIGESPRHPDLDPITQAALTSVCLSILNTDEALTKE